MYVYCFENFENFHTWSASTNIDAAQVWKFSNFSNFSKVSLPGLLMPSLLDEYMHAFAESHYQIANQHRRSLFKKKIQNSQNSQKSARHCNCCVKQLLSWLLRNFLSPRRCAAQWCHDAIFLGIQLGENCFIHMKPFSRTEFLHSQLDSHVTHCIW